MRHRKLCPSSFTAERFITPALKRMYLGKIILKLSALASVLAFPLLAHEHKHGIALTGPHPILPKCAPPLVSKSPVERGNSKFAECSGFHYIKSTDPFPVQKSHERTMPSHITSASSTSHPITQPFLALPQQKYPSATLHHL